MLILAAGAKSTCSKGEPHAPCSGVKMFEPGHREMNVACASLGLDAVWKAPRPGRLHN
jgi:hypothetical protein